MEQTSHRGTVIHLMDYTMGIQVRLHLHLWTGAPSVPKDASLMQTPEIISNSAESLNRSIDRFLRADGWHVSDVKKTEDGSGYDVTLTKAIEPHMGQTVTRHAASAGEATLMACSSARLAMAAAQS